MGSIRVPADLRQNLNRIDLRIVGVAASKLNDDRPIRHGRLETAVDGNAGASRCGRDIEIHQHGLTIDGDRESPLPCPRKIGFGEFQIDVIDAVWNSKLVLEGPGLPPQSLVQRGFLVPATGEFTE